MNRSEGDQHGDPPDSDTLTVRARDGVDIAVDVVGSGPPLIMIPGLGYGAWSWQAQADDLGRDHRVVRIDNRGTGRSGKPPSGYSIDQMALDVVDVAEHLELGPAHLVGSSMGGYIATTVASTAPRLVSSVVLVATTVGGPSCTRVPESTVAAWSAASTLPPSDYARATMPLSFRHGWPERHAADFRQILDRRLEHPTPTFAWSGQFEACEHYLDRGAPSGVIDRPILVIHGTDDRVVPYANTALTLERFPHAELVTLDGAGHLCWIEEADRVSQSIREFVANSTSTTNTIANTSINNDSTTSIASTSASTPMSTPTSQNGTS